VSSDPQRRQALLGVKLSALVRDHWGEAARTPSPFPGGAALNDDGTAWVLVDEEPARALGGALGWARRHQIRQLHVLVEDDVASDLARRARAFAAQPNIWRVRGRSLTVAEPAPLAPRAPSLDGLATVMAAIEAGGAEVIVEHGAVMGEVLGLEVCRVVDGRLQVGVGKHDREAHLLAHGERPALEALPEVVQEVLRFRRPDAPVHQANQLAQERWLRSVVCARPELLGLPSTASLRKVPSPVPRPDLRRPAPAPAAGEDVLVVCSTGVDVDLVPGAADAWMAEGQPSRLLLAVPEGDDHPLTYDLAASLVHPAEVVTVRKDWRSAYPD
jgi:hypothetical protein